jgi:hypothetical protein
MPDTLETPEDRLLTLREAAELCGAPVTLKALRGRVDRGALPVEHSSSGERLVRESSLRTAGLLKAEQDSAGETETPIPAGDHEPVSVDYAELYRERDTALREALERAGAAEERAAIYEARVGDLEQLRESDRAAYDAERVQLIREVEGARATLLALQEPEKVVPELPAVATTTVQERPGFFRRLFGADSAPSE